MLTLQINDPTIELMFTTKFHANQAEFIDFIAESLQKLEVQTNNEEFKFNTLNPKNNSYKIKLEDKHKPLSNPFTQIKDVSSYSKSLRERAYR